LRAVTSGYIISPAAKFNLENLAFERIADLNSTGGPGGRLLRARQAAFGWFR
jgi:hypothetical protein